LSQNSSRLKAEIQTDTPEGKIHQQGIASGVDTLQFVVHTKEMTIPERKLKWLAETWNCVLKKDDSGLYSLEVEISDIEEGQAKRIIASPKLYKSGS
jgi:hypothetical protein